MRLVSPIALPDFRRQARELYTASRRAPKTFQQLDHAVRLVEKAGGRLTSDLTTPVIVRVLCQRGAAANPNTIRGLLSRLRRACRLAIRWGQLDRDDEPDWPSLWPEPVDPAAEPHTAQEVAQLLASLAAGRGDWYSDRLHALASLVAYTGLRRTEALTARVEDVDLERGWIFVTSSYRRLKRRTAAAPVPLPDAVVPTLATWVPQCGGEWLFPGARSGRPWQGGSPGYRPLDRLRAAGDAAGVKGVGFHSLRHTLSTELLTGGVPEWVIQRVLRHTTLLTTRRYLHPSHLETARHVRGFSYPALPGPAARN